MGELKINEAFFEFVQQNSNCNDISKLILSNSCADFDMSLAVTQIECRQKCKNKLPEILREPHFVFPTRVSAEQCSAELVAKFHAELFAQNDKVLDMTAGLMVDDYYISKCVKHITCVEINPIIHEISKHNAQVLCMGNATLVEADSIDFLTNTKDKFDVIFVDPARRDNNYKRFYDFRDCAPDILFNIMLIKSKTRKLVVKGSPMLDIHKSATDFSPYITDIYCVSIKNECKELLFVLDFEKENHEYNLHSLELTNNQQYSLSSNELSNSPLPSQYADLPSAGYLYEPNANLMKIGCFGKICNDFKISKLQQNTHLFHSSEIIENFSGRVFEILEVIPFKELKKMHLCDKYPKANFTPRNVKMSADEFRKKFKIADGGSVYMFGATILSGEQVVIVCSKH